MTERPDESWRALGSAAFRTAQPGGVAHCRQLPRLCLWSISPPARECCGRQGGIGPGSTRESRTAVWLGSAMTRRGLSVSRSFVQVMRSLALLTGLLGAKLGANACRR
jgi:hypothetical protein